MLVLFSITIFVGAALLFLVQPMIARMLLPLLGGTPSVWNTCMVFFQAALLGGYAYSHWTSTRLGMRRQPLAHILVVLAPILVIFGPLLASRTPLSLPSGDPPTDGSPIPWLLATLSLVIGLPFLIASTGGPLLQRWFAATPHPAAKDPYFLYAASNLGSLLALLAYPFMIEPALTLSAQRWLWGIGYVIFAALTIACALVVVRTGGTLPVAATTPGAAPPPPARADSPDARAKIPAKGTPAKTASASPSALPALGAPITLATRLRWTLLAFIPSSLMLGVTQFFSTDIAAFPLLWIIPLAIYLITFVLAFSRRTLIPVASVSKIMPFLVIGLPVASMVDQRPPIAVLLALHLGVMFLCAMLCHGRLAAERPPAKHLTEFYMLVSVGGVLGGAFNALVAPALFNDVYEYPIAVALACFMRPASGPPPAPGRAERNAVALDVLLPIALLLIAKGADMIFGFFQGPITAAVGEGNFYMSRVAANVGIPAILCYFLHRRPVRFGLGMAALFLLAFIYGKGGEGNIVLRERTFFGVYTVEKYRSWLGDGSPGPRFIRMKHGTTLHGIQFAPRQDDWTLDPATNEFFVAGEHPTDPERLTRPLSYYGPDGPCGDIFKAFGGTPLFQRVALVGLGSGSLASYAHPGEHFSIFEIDPAVVRIAENPAYFSYLSHARAKGAVIDIVLGDGRLSLARQPDGAFGLVLLDAFSSDAIPVHLMTKQAVEVYLSKLAPRGVLAFHISNNFLDLAPVLMGIADVLKLQVMYRGDARTGDEMNSDGILSSHWIVLARDRADYGPLARDPRWITLNFKPGDPAPIVWTDDYSDIISVFRWNHP